MGLQAVVVLTESSESHALSSCITTLHLLLPPQVLSVILITIAGTLFVERGTIVTVFIIVYALTSFVGGRVLVWMCFVLLEHCSA